MKNKYEIGQKVMRYDHRNYVYKDCKEVITGYIFWPDLSPAYYVTTPGGVTREVFEESITPC